MVQLGHVDGLGHVVADDTLRRIQDPHVVAARAEGEDTGLGWLYLEGRGKWTDLDLAVRVVEIFVDAGDHVPHGAHPRRQGHRELGPLLLGHRVVDQGHGDLRHVSAGRHRDGQKAEGVEFDADLKRAGSAGRRRRTLPCDRRDKRDGT